ncbi:MAG: hypothetical protein R6T99_08870 [Bacteroidales bacterium]
MKNHLFLLVAAQIILFNICFSQDHNTTKDEVSKISDDLHQIHQYQNTNQKIIRFFESSHLDFQQDTLYVILVPPMNCSRCEGLINPFILELKKLDPKAETMLIAFYKKESALREYLNKRKFQPDHMLACTDEQFLDNFDFGFGNMQVPFFTKICRSSGDLITGKSTLGLDLSEKFVRYILSESSTMPKISRTHDPVPHEEIPEISLDKNDRTVLMPYREIHIKEDENNPLSHIEYPEFDEELRRFAFMDDLSYSIYVYELQSDSGILENTIRPGLKEDRMFTGPGINDTIFRFLKALNILNSMFFSSKFLEDTLVVSASLPRVFWQDREKENIAYYNQITYLYYDLDKGGIIGYVTPEVPPDSSLTLDHLSTYFPRRGKYFVIPVSKGWPVSGSEILDIHDSTDNPFLDAFYDNAPLFAIFNRHGDMLGYWGRLGPFFIKHRLGYAFSSPIMGHDRNTYWYADPYEGILYKYSSLTQQDGVEKTLLYTNRKFQQPRNINGSPMDHIREYTSRMDQHVVDITLHNDSVYCVLKKGAFYEYRILDKHGKLLLKKILPNVYANMEANTFCLHVNQQHKNIIGIYESPQKSSLALFHADHTK